VNARIAGKDACRPVRADKEEIGGAERVREEWMEYGIEKGGE
jgi:hypothetical protein